MTNRPTCPLCGKGLVRRERRSDGKPFYGCSTFPKCRGTLDVSKVEGKNLTSKTTFEATNTIANLEVVEASKYHLNGKPFNPSPRQQAILDFVLNGTGNLFAEAYAGTGKSTTAAFVINQLPRSLQVVLFSFNKIIATEFREKYGLNAMTMHSFCFTAIQASLGRLRVDGQKKNKIAQKYFPLNKSLRRFVIKVAGLALNTCTDYNSVADLLTLIDKYNIEMDESITDAKDDNGQPIPLEWILSTVAPIIIESFQAIEDEKVIDFDEMLAYAVAANLIPKKFDFIFVDEAQDTNALQIEVVLAAIKDTGRFVFVGDRHQAIYGFRGAMTDAVDTIISRIKARVLPLDISYRCPQSHVLQLANPIVADIKAAPSNCEGIIRYNIASMTAIAEWKQLDEALVMCRTNAPLVRQALALIKTGKKARVAGRDIAEGLISLIERVDASNVDQLIEKLTIYRDREVERLTAYDKEDQAELLVDKVDCILAVAEGEVAVLAVIERLNNIFSDERGGILFSSVHRAKGMEAREVYIIEPNQMPFGKANKAWQKKQECNLAYVAFTRSLYRMTFVAGSPNMGKLTEITLVEEVQF